MVDFVSSFRACKKKNVFQLGLVALLFACSGVESNNNIYGEIYPIDRLNRKYYEQLGGQEILGPAISPLLPEVETIYQFTIASLISYNLTTETHYLAPIGKDLGITELPIVQQPDNKNLYINGHYVFPAFETLYDQLGGLVTIGSPLTEVRINQQERRYEQYFENLGFYMMEDNHDNQVFLLSYGAWKCGPRCSQITPPNSRIDLPVKMLTPIRNFVEEIGSDFTGFALTEPYLAQDGNLEQVFENVVLFINPNHPDKVHFRELPKLVGYQDDPQESPISKPDFFFFPVEGEMGFNIPIQFLEYIKIRGGLKISGSPITKAKSMAGNYLMQCFEKLCLKESNNIYDLKSISPLPIGYLYRDQLYLSQINTFQDQPRNQPETEISINLWERYPMISNDLKQEIRVVILDGSKPLSSINPVLTLMLSVKKSYIMPPSDKKGESRIQLDPIYVESGTLVPYQVCIDPPNTQKFCVRDSYLVWDVVKMGNNDKNIGSSIYQLIEDRLRKIDELVHPK